MSAAHCKGWDIADCFTLAPGLPREPFSCQESLKEASRNALEERSRSSRGVGCSSYTRDARLRCRRGSRSRGNSLPAPTKQAEGAETGGEERESCGQGCDVRPVGKADAD